MIKILIKNKFISFICINLIFLLIEILLNIFQEKNFIPSFGYNILPGIIKTNTGLLSNDFFTSNFDNTPKKISISLFSFFLPNDKNNIISSYSLIMLYLKSFTETCQIFFITLIFYNIKNYPKINTSISNFNLVFFLFSLFYKLINYLPSLVLHNSESYKKIIKYLHIYFINVPIKGAVFGGWDFPQGANIRGISFTISLIGITIPLILSLYKFKINRKVQSLLLFNIFIFNLFATLIHPVSPFLVILIAFIYLLIIQKKFLFYYWKNILIVYLTSSFLGIFILLNMFPQIDINNVDLYNIYVAFRHPHHYQPSFYIFKLKFIIAFIIQLLTTSFIYLINHLYLGNIYLKRIILYSYFALFSLQISQYILVELLKIKIFINFGFSSLGSIYIIYHIVLVIYFMYLIQKKYQFLWANIFIKNVFIISQIMKKKQFIYFLFSLVLLFSILCLNFNYTKINNSLTSKISNEVSKYQFLNESEFIIDDELKKEFIYPRAIGGFSIYSDYLYPFNLKGIKEWQQRVLSLKQLKECINRNSSDCYLSSEVRVFYISENINKGLTSNILRISSDDKEIFIQEVDTKKL